jgi:RNA polymerase sigma-70 factor (ECF subfamily)
MVVVLEAAATELELARDLMGGGPQAFERFLDLYHTKIFRYAYTMCGHREDAEEVAQETLFQVFRSFAQLKEPEKLKAWVFRIAKNVCLMKRRKSLFAPREEVSLDELRPARSGEHLKLEIADWSKLPEDLAANRELHAALQASVRSLPETYRAVFLLRDVEGFSTDEAAHILELTPDTIKQRLHRARLRLRKDLDQFAQGGKNEPRRM